MSDLEGVMLSEYVLTRCISKGGVADVYRAHQVNEQGASGPFEVAVKVFRPGYAQRESFRTYFMTEAEKIGRLNHANILPFLEYGEGEDLLYLVTPFVANGTLDDLLKRVGGHFSATQALPVMQHVCSAVQFAHDHDVLHGNIKPSNVFVTADGRMLLSDFGIARGYDDSQQSLTRVGWGSAEYAAPEQSLGVVRRASDVYSLGILLFHILTGSTPFTGQTPVEVLLKHVRQQPPSARSFVPTVSDAVDEVLQKAMRKRSDDRFASVAELSTAFAQAVLLAPVAPSLSRPMPTIKLRPLQEVAKTNPLTPPLFSPLPETVPEPQTPFPAYSMLNAALPAATSQTREFSPSFAPPLFEASNAAASTFPTAFPTSHLAPANEDRPETPHFLTEEREHKDDGAGVGPQEPLFWSVNPAEWSPIAKETVEPIPGDVPFTANEYLQSKPLVLVMPDEVMQQKKYKTFNARLHALLPLLVVFLLLLGLLGALLSAFFYPTERSGAHGGVYGTSHTTYIYVVPYKKN